VENNKKRYPTLCSWCEHCITGRDIGRRAPLVNPPSGYSTYCLHEHFDNDGKENYPDIVKCADYKIDPKVTYVDTLWWPIAWAAAEINRLEIKKTIMEWNDSKITNQ
jgi:hypothetical protein